MALSNATKDEIRMQVQEGIASAFMDIDFPPPDYTEAIEKIEIKVDNHDRFINGNGNTGAKTDIQLIRQSLETIEKWKDSVDKKTWAIIFLIITSLITNIINLSTKLQLP